MSIHFATVTLILNKLKKEKNIKIWRYVNFDYKWGDIIRRFQVKLEENTYAIPRAQILNKFIVVGVLWNLDQLREGKNIFIYFYKLVLVLYNTGISTRKK